MADRKLQESIDKRNSAVMQLEAEHRRLRMALQLITDAWQRIDPDAQVPDELNDGRMEDAILILKQIKKR